MRSLSQAPDRVIRPLIMPPQDGIHSMIEKVMPSTCAQSGQCRVVQMVRARPDVEEDQRPEMDDRQAIAVDRPVGLLRHEIVHHAEEAGGEEEADRVVAVPPLGQRILDAGEQRVALHAEERDRHRQVVDDVQHRDGDDEGQVEPVGDVDVRLLAPQQRAEEDDQIGDPDEGQPEVDIPFGLGILAALADAQDIAQSPPSR